jgi:predicted nucleic acid-binding protein
VGVKAVFDTNILIDYLNGFTEAKAELSRYDERLVRVITWMEVVVGTNVESEAVVGRFLNNFRVVGVVGEVILLGVTLRREQRLKLPDAIVYATSQAENCLFITRNTKDFSPALPNVRVPYEL